MGRGSRRNAATPVIDDIILRGCECAAELDHAFRPAAVIQQERAATGFSGMEIETACRYNLPVKIAVLNNGGIGSGIEALP